MKIRMANMLHRRGRTDPPQPNVEIELGSPRESESEVTMRAIQIPPIEAMKPNEKVVISAADLEGQIKISAKRSNQPIGNVTVPITQDEDAQNSLYDTTINHIRNPDNRPRLNILTGKLSNLHAHIGEEYHSENSRRCNGLICISNLRRGCFVS
jgi:hypothetical protein